MFFLSLDEVVEGALVPGKVGVGGDVGFQFFVAAVPDFVPFLAHVVAHLVSGGLVFGEELAEAVFVPVEVEEDVLEEFYFFVGEGIRFGFGEGLGVLVVVVHFALSDGKAVGIAVEVYLMVLVVGGPVSVFFVVGFQFFVVHHPVLGQHFVEVEMDGLEQLDFLLDEVAFLRFDFLFLVVGIHFAMAAEDVEEVLDVAFRLAAGVVQLSLVGSVPVVIPFHFIEADLPRFRRDERDALLRRI
mmetsp:Transcript_24601/g.56337  ORF Transcript_24601/g.56337 Transcript_24601/m.56337 type:complete len:242 (+) Transcript_24601:1136-1861(+)